MALTDEDESFLRGITKEMNATKDLKQAVSEETTKISHRGQLTYDQVEEIAGDFFDKELRGRNNWDRRRILMRLERLYRNQR